MRRMLDPKTIGGGGGGSVSELHLYDVEFWYYNQIGEFHLSFASTKLLPGFTKPGDSLNNKSMKDYPEFFPKVNIALPCSGAIIVDDVAYPCISVSIIVDNYDTDGYVLPKIIKDNRITTTTNIATNGKLKITRRY